MAGESQRQLTRTVVVETHPVEQSPVGRQPEQPRRRISRLRTGGHRADLRVAESQCTPGLQAVTVLIEPGGQPERTGEVRPEHRACQDRVVRRQRPAQRHPGGGGGGGPPQGAEHQGVDTFGGRQEQRPAHRLVDHGPG